MGVYHPPETPDRGLARPRGFRHAQEGVAPPRDLPPRSHAAARLRRGQGGKPPPTPPPPTAAPERVEMAIPQLAIRVQSRSRGHSMAKALAYRHGLHLFAVRTGRSCNYLRRVERKEIAHTGLGRFDGLDRSWTLDDAQGLADRIDLGERRRNSTIARDFESALPHELDDLQQYALAQEWSDFLAARYHTPVPFAVHRPPPDGDERNLHVHALVPDRAVADDGVTMGAKLRVLSELVGRGPQEVLALRLAWQEHVNRALLEAGFDEQIDMGRTRPAGDPGLHLGPKLIGRERRRQREAGIEPDGRGVLARADKNSSEIVQRAARQVAGLRKPPAYKPSPLRERPGRRTSTAKTGVGRAAAKRFRRERPSRAQHARRAPPTYEDTSRSTFVATQRKPLRMPAVPRPKPRHDVAFLTRRTITPEMVRGRTRRRVPLTSEEASRITFTATRREPLRMPPVPRPKPRPELAYGAHRSVPPEATKERSAKRSVPANKPRRSALVLREAHERRREYWRQHYQRQRSAGRFDSRAQTRSAGASHSSSRSPRAHAPDYGVKGSRSARGTTERRRRRRRDRPTVATVARAPNYGAIGATSERGPRAKRSQASAAPGWSDAAQPYREDRPLRKRRRRLRTERTVQARQLFPPNKLLMDINHLEDRIRSGQKELAQEQERQRREKELAREQERQRREKELAREQERQRREKELAQEQERQRREKELAREQERRRREKELAQEQERQRREKELAQEQERQRREKELAREQERRRREKELAREQERQRREKELAREQERQRREKELAREQERQRREKEAEGTRTAPPTYRLPRSLGAPSEPPPAKEPTPTPPPPTESPAPEAPPDSIFNVEPPPGQAQPPQEPPHEREIEPWTPPAPVPSTSSVAEESRNICVAGEEEDHEQASRRAAVDEIALRALADGADRLDVIAKLGSIMSSTAAIGAEHYLRRDVEPIARDHYHGETRPPHADDRRWPGNTRRDRQQARAAAIERAIAEWRDPHRREALYGQIERVIAVNQESAPVAPPESPPRTTDAESDAERDQALLELTRQRAREAGVDDLDAPRERGGAGRESSGGARDEQVEALPDADPRGARERGEVRAELEAQILAGVEAAGEAQILNYAGIKIEDLLPYGVGELSGLLDDGGFVDGITHGRPEREPVRSAVERWRGHCETHLGDIASMLLEALWPEHWERYRKTRRRGEPKRVPTRDERDQVMLDATQPPASTQRRWSRDQGPDHGLR